MVERAEEPEDQRSTDATEGTDVPNVLVKPNIFITHLHVIPNL